MNRRAPAAVKSRCCPFGWVGRVVSNQCKNKWLLKGVLIFLFCFNSFLSNSQVPNPGQIGISGGGTSQCINTGTTPSAFISIVDASGGGAFNAYIWERSNVSDFSSLTQVGAISAYTETATLSTVTYYRRKVINLSSGLFETSYSNIITIGINPTFTPVLSTLPIICQGTLSFPVNYTTTETPDKYTINWDATAVAAGFTDVVDATLLPTPNSFTVSVPPGAAVGIYSGSLSVKVTSTGCFSAFTTSSLQINALPTIASQPSSSVQNICLNGTSTALSVTATVGSGTMSTVEWYSNTSNSNSGGVLVATHATLLTTDSYTPLTNVAGSLYYYAVVTNSNGCTVTSGVSGLVTVNALPTIASQPSSSAQNICLNGTSTALSVTATVGSGTMSTVEWYSNTSNSNSGGVLVATHATVLTTDSYTPLTNVAGSLYYYAVVTNSNGCTVTSGVSGLVTVNALPTIASQPSSSAQNICLNGTSTALSVTATVGSGTMSTVEWYSNTSNSNSGGVLVATHATVLTTDSYTPLTNVAGSLYYYAVVTNSNGCTVTSGVSGSVTVNALPTVTINASGPITFCSGGSVSLSSTTGVSYTWSSGETTQSVMVSSSGSKTVTMKDVNGCVATSAPLFVTVNPLPTLTINTPNPVCAPGTVDLTAASITAGSTAGLTYTQYSDIGLTQLLANPNAVATGNTYYIKGTTAAGCSASLPVSVVINTLPNLNITNPSAVCAPAGIDLTSADIVTGSTNGLSYTIWSDAANTIPLANATAITTSGIYYIKGSLPATGCSVSKPVSATIHTKPNLTINNPSPVCFPATVNLTSGSITAGSGSGLSFGVYTDGNAGQLLANPGFVAASGTYYIKATDAVTGCFVIQPVTASIQALPSITVVNPPAVCAPGVINITAPSVVTSGNTGINVTHWRDAATTIPLTNASAVNSSGTYYVKGISQTGCSVVKTVNVTINPQPGLTVTSPDPVCSPATVNLFNPGIVAGSATGVDYSFWTDASATVGLTNASAVGTEGTYYIKAVYPSTGCSNIQPVTVRINNPPVLQINTPAPVCEPLVIDLTAASVTTGSTAGTLLSYWKDAANSIPLPNPGKVNTGGTYFIRSVAASGCTASLPVSVTIHPLPGGTLENPAINYICEGSSVQLIASAADSYQWLLNQLPVNGANTATYAASQPGNYSVRFISREGCEKTADNSIRLDLITKPVLQFTTAGLCADLPIQFVNNSRFANSGGISWVWDFGDGASSNLLSPTHGYQLPGNYEVSLTAVNASCPDLTEKQTQTISISPPSPGVRYDTVSAVGGLPVTLTARPIGIFYEWQPPSGLNSNQIRTPQATLNADAFYTVKITTANGCTTTDSVYIKVTTTGEIYVPRGFSPNGDGQNDRAFPILRGIQKLQYFKIYNRWGNLVFQTNDATAQNGWDGNYIGKPQPVGTYTWIAEAIDGKGQPVKRSGNLLLIR